MRSWKSLVAAAAGLMLAPQLATASDVEEQLRQMQERMAQLEDKLQAQDDQLSAAEKRVQEQERLIQEAGISDESTGSALSRFLEQTEFSGVVAASWNWNFNNPSSGTTAAFNNPSPPGGSGTGFTNGGLNSGTLGLTAPFHSNSNSFQLDQLLFSMMKPATVESRGGFGVDLAFGASADALRNAGCSNTDVGVGGCTGNGNSGDLTFLYQAYAEYLAPIGNGLLVKGGRFETLLGYEVFRADQNLNITRGIVYAMQPTSHTGLLLSSEVASGVSMSLGIANDTGNTMADSDRNKALLGQIAWSGETASLALNGYSGGDIANPFTPILSGVGRDNDRLTILDVVGTWDPSDQLTVYTNFDYFWTRKDKTANGDSNYWGLAAGGRYGVTDAMGVGVRGEIARRANVVDTILWEITATLDYALTDNLKALLEFRYDRGAVESASNNFFTTSSGFFTDADQTLGLVQLMYTF
jgi:hypothetical protein